MDGKCIFFGKRQQTFLIFFNINGCDPFHHTHRYFQFFKFLYDQFFNVIFGGTPAAPDAQMKNTGTQHNRLNKRLYRLSQGNCQADRSPFRQNQSVRKRASDWKLTLDPHLFAIYQIRGKGFGGLHIKDRHIMPGSPFIHSKQIIHIRRGSNYGNCFQKSSNPRSQTVRAANMTRKQGDDKLPLFINRNHRRVFGLTADIRSNTADGDPRRADKHHQAAQGKGLFAHYLQRRTDFL